MNWNMLLAGLAVFVASQVAAAELTLFDVELRTATPEQLHRSAVAGGARMLTRSAGHRVYDVSKVGLPGAHRLEVLFDGDRFDSGARVLHGMILAREPFVEQVVVKLAFGIPGLARHVRHH